MQPQPNKEDVECLICYCVNTVFPFDTCFANLIKIINMFNNLW